MKQKNSQKIQFTFSARVSLFLVYFYKMIDKVVCISINKEQINFQHFLSVLSRLC